MLSLVIQSRFYTKHVILTEKVLSKDCILEDCKTKLFRQFEVNYLKANGGKYHVSNNEQANNVYQYQMY